MRNRLNDQARALYDFGFALTGDRDKAENLAVEDFCRSDKHPPDSRSRLMCSMRRLLSDVLQDQQQFKSSRPEDLILRGLDVMGRAFVAARFRLHLSGEERRELLGLSAQEEVEMMLKVAEVERCLRKRMQ